MRHRRGKMNFWSITLTALVVVTMFVLIVWIFGGVSGQEFSPQKFTLRNFHYFQLPLVRMQIWPIRFRRVRGDDDKMAKHIRTKRWLGQVSTETPRWDVVSLDEIGRLPMRGEAAILTNYLKQPGTAGTSSWLDWSKQHADIAAKLWPLVARLAHEKIYELIPEVFDAARLATSSNEFDAAARALLTTELPQLAEAEQVAGNAERASSLRTLSQELAENPLPTTHAPPVPEAEAEAEAEADPDPEDVSHQPGSHTLHNRIPQRADSFDVNLNLVVRL